MLTKMSVKLNHDVTIQLEEARNKSEIDKKQLEEAHATKVKSLTDIHVQVKTNLDQAY